MTPEDDRMLLIQELRELMGVRMAVVLVPAMRALDSHGHRDLRVSIEAFLGPIEQDLAVVLAKYDVKRKDESPE